MRLVGAGTEPVVLEGAGLGTTGPGDVLGQVEKVLRGAAIGYFTKDLLFALYRCDVAARGFEGVAEFIEDAKLWFSELSAEEYRQLAEEIIDQQQGVLREFVGNKKYPQGKLMFLVGQMMRRGPEGRVSPQSAERVLRAAIEERVGSRSGSGR